MKMFGNMTTDGLEAVGDRLGGAGILDSDFYPAKVKIAYATKSQGGATGITVIFDLGSREYRETVWVTKTTGENFYADKNDPKKKIPLPGFTTINDLCLLTTNAPLSEQDFEEKVVNIYDYEQKKDIPTNVPVLVGVIGKEVGVGIIRQTVDKQAKGTDGVYRNTGETRDENVIDKLFHEPTGVTVTEAMSGITEPVFKGKWLEANKGKTKNRAKGSEGTAGAPGGLPGSKPAASGLFGGGAAGAAPAAKKGLFGG